MRERFRVETEVVMFSRIFEEYSGGEAVIKFEADVLLETGEK